MRGEMGLKQEYRLAEQMLSVLVQSQASGAHGVQM